MAGLRFAFTIDAQDESGQPQHGFAAPLTLTLVENPDIIAQVASEKRPGQIVIGFAAESHDMVENGTLKLKKITKIKCKR